MKVQLTKYKGISISFVVQWFLLAGPIYKYNNSIIILLSANKPVADC